ncbi:relaxase/mobilization nuclease domain-containing protein [Vibrio sp. 1409]|uniref:relaxase/mobilization nuclease domain-containing protein n=1 Tax=Vibrio sp. 1409 TaxID=3074558 RepID=UPI001CF4EC39|nr:relaxase/mobilization nuclease domain-containing protein [Vibrio alginolyticus]MDW2260811.1 relaxase/mobilization nuclease domain-containing protein [Vibrio sp. 1409]HCG5474455.1 relaxase/mobilization nuclease domain-containing protein [Vibrio parahaemolyticus]
MIVKFFKGSHKTACDGLDYLEGGTKTRKVAPQLLRGNPELTREYLKIADKFARAYTYGCLSFEEKNIPIEKKLILMDEFESTLMAGLDKDQYDMIWIEHRDTDRLELNFHVVNMELTSGKSLTPYVHKRDMGRIDAWKNLANDRFNFTNPNNPDKERTFTFANNSAARRDVMIHIDRYILDRTLDGELNSRQEIVDALNDIEGVTVSRQAKKSISITVDGYEKPFRLKSNNTNHIYGEHYSGVENLQQHQEERARRFKEERNDRVKRNRIDLRERLATISEQRRAQYPKFVPAPEAVEPDLSDDFNPSDHPDFIRVNLVRDGVSNQPVSTVSTNHQEQRDRADLLSNKEDKNTQNQKLNNDANNNNPQHESAEPWVQKLIRTIKQSIESFGERIRSLQATGDSFRNICYSTQQNCHDLDRHLTDGKWGAKIIHAQAFKSDEIGVVSNVQTKPEKEYSPRLKNNFKRKF